MPFFHGHLEENRVSEQISNQRFEKIKKMFIYYLDGTIFQTH